MKKKLFFVAAAALALVSCNNDVTISENTALVGSNEQREISFYAVSNSPKRAIKRAPVQGATFPTANTMEVRAYRSYPSGAEFFPKTTFSREEITTGNYAWRGATKRYWPLSEAVINFFAVSGNGVNASHITIADALASATVAYTSTNSYDETSQSDIMYAFNRDSVTQSGNTLTYHHDKVAMVFKHALALINFQIKAGDAASTAISIKKIELNGARYTGTLTIANNDKVTARSGDWSATVNWVPNDVVNNVQVPNIGNTSSPVALTQAYVPDNSDTEVEADWASLMIIPSEQTGSEDYGFTTFTIYYQLDNKDYTYTFAPAGYTSTTPNLTAVEAGNKYTYQITMTLHEILVNPTVTPWAEQNSADNVNIPE